jgi:hypothetical protein
VITEKKRERKRAYAYVVFLTKYKLKITYKICFLLITFSEGCSDDFDDYKDRAVEYIAHLGECYRQRTNDDSCTYQNNGVKTKVCNYSCLAPRKMRKKYILKITNATKLSTVAFNSSPLHLWEIVYTYEFKPNNYIRPVCLFNKDATRDFDTSQIYTSMYYPTRVRVLTYSLTQLSTTK